VEKMIEIDEQNLVNMPYVSLVICKYCLSIKKDISFPYTCFMVNGVDFDIYYSGYREMTEESPSCM
jgi:hypothetical protein